MTKLTLLVSEQITVSIYRHQVGVVVNTVYAIVYMLVYVYVFT